MLCIFDNDRYAALKQRQQYADKFKDTHNDFTIIPLGSIVVMQNKDRGSWTHGTVVKHGFTDHNNRSYKVSTTKAGHIITRTACQFTIPNIHRAVPMK